MEKHIYFAGGCFWGVEKYFSLITGVNATETGYANGHTDTPTYEQVCRGDSGFAETVKVTYNSQDISLDSLLKAFFEIIDPTAINRQGQDEGTQYRSGIYYSDTDEHNAIKAFVSDLQRNFDSSIVTEILPLQCYYPAEEYHQKYLENNPSGYCHIDFTAFEKARNINASGYTCKSKEDLRQELTDLQYRVTQESETEEPFENEYYNQFREGIYVDVTTGEPLFISTDKFDAGCGWPSFSKPISQSLISEFEDKRDFNPLAEVRSTNSGAHLGHVFDDGPEEAGGLRYCINSAALRFIPKEMMKSEGYEKYLKLLE